MALITGASRGLGLETARQLLTAGHDVWMGARDAEGARAIVRAVCLGHDGPTGAFLDAAGVVAW
jgi:NAD(P)-dependent dehydrogenase (short-subunit alcohol dehydrogenase family)